MVDRNVDVLLTDPKNSQSKSIAIYHFRLTINPQSGFLILEPGDSKRALQHLVGDRWEDVVGRRVVYEKSMTLRAGECDYKLEYAIQERHKLEYMDMRNAFLATLADPGNQDRGIYDQFAVIPGTYTRVIGKCIKFEARLGHGTFGWVDQGLDIETGDLLAIKEVRITHERDWLTIKRELEIGMHFEVSLLTMKMLSDVDTCKDRRDRSTPYTWLLLPAWISE